MKTVSYEILIYLLMLREDDEGINLFANKQK